MKTKYTKEILEILAKECSSLAQVLKKLGLKQTGGSQSHIKRLMKMNDIDTSHFKGQRFNSGENYKGGCVRLTPQNLLIQRDVLDTPIKGSLLKRSLLEIGRPNICAMCGMEPFWNGKELSFQVDHKNGNKNDNREDNLRLVCPNCHSQTENFGSKNKKKGDSYDLRNGLSFS